ncbi:hypothetical protein IFM89_025773 [Coptis chinensis]|uniref:Uncharacterized protein n=1 Tax=Coptis chinensis TaxID=261450 RepID=A0A835HY33_9MAGN|nr:hypothetical protein IFM89_025773 [Coptis chinensis]
MDLTQWGRPSPVPAHKRRMKKVMEGIASIALLPSGCISGHFIHLPDSVCYGLQGTEDVLSVATYALNNYTLVLLQLDEMTHFATEKERAVVVECKGHDAARFQNVDQAHGWEEDVTDLVEQKYVKRKLSVSFECETLKAEKEAEDHIRKFMPNLAGLDAVVNVGRMSIEGLDFEALDSFDEKHEPE